MTAYQILSEAIEPRTDGETRRMRTMLEKLAKHLHLPDPGEDFRAYLWLQQNLVYPRGQYILCHSTTQHIAPWFIAENGGRVLLVERGEDRFLRLVFRSRYAVGGFYRNELESSFAVIKREFSLADGAGKKFISLVENISKLLGQIFPPVGKGSVLLLRESPWRLEQIPAKAVDQVILPDTIGFYALPQCGKILQEMKRVLKPGGSLLFNLRLTNGSHLFQDEKKSWIFPLEKFAPLLNLDENKVEEIRSSISNASTFTTPQGGGEPIVEVGFKITKEDTQE